MNKQRKNRIREIIDQLENFQLEISKLQELEQSAFDNLNEGLQSTEMGRSIELAADNLDEANGSIEDLIDFLNEVI